MKHVKLHVHSLRHLEQYNVVTLVYCMVHDQIVDILTKPLPEYRFLKVQAIIELQEVAVMDEYSKNIS